MTFFQRYSFIEDTFGEQFIYFSISNHYNSLKSGTAQEVDIFNLEDVKQDLNLEDGSFAIDELTFNINELSCHTQNDYDCLEFVKDCASLENSRYCAVFFGEYPTDENVLFSGKIFDKISGTGKVNDCNDFDIEIKEKREYKFSALSFDISILERCKHTEKIVDDYGNNIPNIYDRLSANDYQPIKSIFDWRLFNIDGLIFYNAPLGSLTQLLNLILEKASEIIYELINTNINFQLQYSNLGFSINPLKVSNINNEYEWLHNFITIENDLQQIKKVMIGTNDNILESSIYISRKLVDSLIGIRSDTLSTEQSYYNSEQQFSIKAINNVADLLFEIARATGTFVNISLFNANTFNMEFKSRAGIVEDNDTYIVNSTSSSIDTASQLSKGVQEFYSQGTIYSADGLDVLDIDHNSVGAWTYEPKPSENLKTLKNKLQKTQDNNGKGGRLLLSVSPILVKDRSLLTKAYKPNEIINYTYPLNTVRTDYKPTNWDIRYLNEEGNFHNNYGNQLDSSIDYTTWAERLYTGIYINLVDSMSQLGGYELFRPASNILVNINGTNHSFKSLSEYINFITFRDKQFYLTEIEKEIPYWNGFSKSINGSSPNWKNLKLGSKINVKESVRRFEMKIELDNLASDGVNATAYKINHGLETGDLIAVLGANENDFNGIKSITKINNDEFSFSSTFTGQATGKFKFFKIDSWVEADVLTKYVVVSITRSLNSIKTKIKLQKAERFAYGFFDGVNTKNYILNGELINESQGGTPTVQNYKVYANSSVAKYDAVRVIYENGQYYVAPSESKSLFQDTTIGIALESGSNLQEIPIQVSGKVEITGSTLTAGKMLYARTKHLNGITYINNTNLTETFLTSKNSNENLVIQLGKIDTTNSFILNIKEAYFE